MEVSLSDDDVDDVMIVEKPPIPAKNDDMLVESDIPKSLARVRMPDLPGGSGGIPMNNHKDELFEAVSRASLIILDAATATGQLLDPIAGQK